MAWIWNCGDALEKIEEDWGMDMMYCYTMEIQKIIKYFILFLGNQEFEYWLCIWSYY